MKYDTGLNAARGRLRVLGLFIAIGFMLVALFLVYWTLFRGASILARDDNPRLVLDELNIRRGTIFDANNQVLAETVGSAGALRRVYPASGSGPAVGYYSFRHGTAGIEEGMDQQLRGEVDNPLSNWWLHDVLHEEIVGRDIRLTIDTRWQQAADDILGNKPGSVLLFSIPDFSIRAMVSKPGYDPNQLDEEFTELTEDERAPLVNRVTQGQYQPGLVIQPFLMASALANDLISLDDLVLDAARPFPVNGYTLFCENQPEDDLSWRQILQYRCPYPLTQLARQIEEDGISASFESFGIFEPPLLPIATDSSEQQLIESLELAAIGQDVQSVSPLQIARALAALANEGRLPQFQLVSATQDQNGFWIPEEFEEMEGSPLPPSVARDILAALPANQGIAEHSVLVLSGPDGSTNSWYLGLAPAEDPRFGIVVVVEDSDDQQTADEIGRELLKLGLSGELSE